jgi:hypothetical protein
MARAFLKTAKAKLSQMLGLAPGTSYVFVGNPGGGKSTLLNSLTESNVFASGVSYGGGKTSALQHYEFNQISFYDTPGLADTKLRKEAAEAITKVFKKGGDFKVFFVLTLQSGRVLEQDRTTMEEILRSAPITDYGVIFNKVGPQVYEHVSGNLQSKDCPPGVGARDAIVMQLMAGVEVQSVNIHLIKDDPRFTDKSQEDAPAMDPEIKNALIAFMNKVAPCQWQAADVKEITHDAAEWKQHKKELEELISKMSKDKDFFQECVAEERENFRKMLEQSNQREDDLRKHFEDVEKQTSQQLKQMHEDFERERDSLGEAAAKRRKMEIDSEAAALKDELHSLRSQVKSSNSSGSSSGSFSDVLSGVGNAVGGFLGIPGLGSVVQGIGQGLGSLFGF